MKWGGGVVAAAAGSALLPSSVLQPAAVYAQEPRPSAAGASGAAAPALVPVNLHLAATDGWVYIGAPPIPPFHPDNVAPAGLTTYIFGFRDVTSYTNDPGKVAAQKMKAQLAAPIFSIDEGTDFHLKLSNLGLQIRPDLIDSHTLHFHGFRNAIPIFDGEPHSSVGVPIVRELTYFYHPRHPGTYMYHCHFEETEHVHMGMIGGCYVKPQFNQLYPGRKFAYNDMATEYDREWLMVLYEVWAEAHWCDSHIQLPEWTDYKPDMFILNGRSYPDTLAASGGDVDPTTGDLLGPVVEWNPDGTPKTRRDELRYQPVSSLVRAKEGERVLLRFINLGYTEVSMRLAGIKMRIVARDAMLLKGRDGTDLSFLTSTAPGGPGETSDAIFVAPAFSGAQGLSDEYGAYDRYLLYNRAVSHMGGGSGSSYGGQMTEVRIYAASAPFGPQTAPNTTPRPSGA